MEGGDSDGRSPPSPMDAFFGRPLPLPLAAHRVALTTSAGGDVGGGSGGVGQRHEGGAVARVGGDSGGGNDAMALSTPSLPPPVAASPPPPPSAHASGWPTVAAPSAGANLSGGGSGDGNGSGRSGGHHSPDATAPLPVVSSPGGGRRPPPPTSHRWEPPLDLGSVRIRGGSSDVGGGGVGGGGSGSGEGDGVRRLSPDLVAPTAWAPPPPPAGVGSWPAPGSVLTPSLTAAAVAAAAAVSDVGPHPSVAAAGGGAGAGAGARYGGVGADANMLVDGGASGVPPSGRALLPLPPPDVAGVSTDGRVLWSPLVCLPVASSPGGGGGGDGGGGSSGGGGSGGGGSGGGHMAMDTGTSPAGGAYGGAVVYSAWSPLPPLAPFPSGGVTDGSPEGGVMWGAADQPPLFGSRPYSTPRAGNSSGGGGGIGLSGSGYSPLGAVLPHRSAGGIMGGTPPLGELTPGGSGWTPPLPLPAPIRGGAGSSGWTPPLPLGLVGGGVAPCAPTYGDGGSGIGVGGGVDGVGSVSGGGGVGSGGGDSPVGRPPSLAAGAHDDPTVGYMPAPAPLPPSGSDSPPSSSRRWRPSPRAAVAAAETTAGGSVGGARRPPSAAPTPGAASAAAYRSRRLARKYALTATLSALPGGADAVARVEAAAQAAGDAARREWDLANAAVVKAAVAAKAAALARGEAALNERERLRVLLNRGSRRNRAVHGVVLVEGLEREIAAARARQAQERGGGGGSGSGAPDAGGGTAPASRAQ
ncbi:hypothetical protein MMPV_006447 [Pyropia vietnamensis]